MMNEKQLQHLMSLAAADAYEGMKKGDGGPFGAIVCQGERIVSTAHNSVFLLTDPTAHAEITAIREACRTLGRLHLEDCTLITTCEPCPMCLSAIFWAHIPAVYYSCTRQDAEEIGFIDHHIYRALQNGNTGDIKLTRIDSPECTTLFQTWQEAQYKKPY